MKRAALTVYREKAILVGIELDGSAAGVPPPPDPLEELAALARTAGAEVCNTLYQRRKTIHPATFLGAGKAEELAALATSHDADVIIFDHDLSPSQIRNLEKITHRKVLDRTELILDIFATHARSREATLQVELAQMEYTLPRLAHLWGHLEKITGAATASASGGIGTRGPGEKQLEVDRRLARKRVLTLKREIAQVEARKRREVEARSDNFAVGLVGYTNAGKSTLMNRLARTDVLVEDKLFSTLDTKTHTWTLRSRQKVLLSDTVGFIRDLPHHLVTSFHATLEEVTQADLLLHVVDASSPEAEGQIAAVREVLQELEAADTPTLMVLNKIDRVEDPIERQILARQHPEAVIVSARTGEGLDLLDGRVDGVLSARQMRVELSVPAGDGRTLAYLAAVGTIEEQKYRGSRAHVVVRIAERALRKVPPDYIRRESPAAPTAAAAPQ